MSKLLSGDIGHHNSFQTIDKLRKQIQQKWGESGLLDGLTGHVNTNFAQMLECCSSARLNEVEPTGDTTNNITN